MNLPPQSIYLPADFSIEVTNGIVAQYRQGQSPGSRKRSFQEWLEIHPVPQSTSIPTTDIRLYRARGPGEDHAHAGGATAGANVVLPGTTPPHAAETSLSGRLDLD